MGKLPPCHFVTSTVRCPEAKRFIWSCAPKLLKKIKLWSVSITRFACSKSPIDNNCGTSSSTTVRLMTPGLPPRMHG